MEQMSYTFEDLKNSVLSDGTLMKCFKVDTNKESDPFTEYIVRGEIRHIPYSQETADDHCFGYVEVSEILRNDVAVPDAKASWKRILNAYVKDEPDWEFPFVEKALEATKENVRLYLMELFEEKFGV